MYNNIEIKIEACNIPIEYLPMDGTCCVDLETMTYINTNMPVNLDYWLIEDHSERYSRAFNIDFVDIFSSINEIEDDRFIKIQTYHINSQEWYKYEVIHERVKYKRDISYFRQQDWTFLSSWIGGIIKKWESEGLTEEQIIEKLKKYGEVKEIKKG